jgi:hypothetical protein
MVFLTSEARVLRGTPIYVTMALSYPKDQSWGWVDD